ncbi:hypothetical protein BV321_01280 [Pseudomonas syringae pv. actinidiae]|nr:hypothetical protein [Pseudomonas savastanoi pv. phaseolicola]OSN37334.1 hypothetical protein BV343_01123 [Pseudomonas syringae pv. actinidiae]RMR93438.1 hypothetical protein ALP76_00919 [Pseudomonas savastanoi pv. glycinea]OSN45084.1 hypothetical protein BV344_01126 [Pseudomonas syringae pv. actinidiae]OSR31886.1 hypothetical protein BV320_05099 [Pseudomonas syringae pv. actinidiae]
MKQALLKALRAHQHDWPGLLNDLPSVSVPAPYPDVLDDLRGLCLLKESLDGVSLTFSDLSYSTFHSCSMKRVRLQGAKLSWASFEKSNLLQSDLLQVVADHAVFDDCNLAFSIMMTGNYRDGSFKNANLRKCILNGCDFTGSELSNVKLLAAEAFNVKVPDSFNLSLHLRGFNSLEP